MTCQASQVRVPHSYTILAFSARTIAGGCRVARSRFDDSHSDIRGFTRARGAQLPHSCVFGWSLPQSSCARRASRDDSAAHRRSRGFSYRAPQPPDILSLVLLESSLDIAHGDRHFCRPGNATPPTASDWVRASLRSRPSTPIRIPTSIQLKRRMHKNIMSFK